MAHKNAPQDNKADIIDKIRDFWDFNSKKVTYAGVAVVLLIAGIFIYRNIFLQPKVEKSNDVVFITQKYFTEFANTADTSRNQLATKVLNGDGVNPGALKIINQYGGTQAANLCRYYAGACYLSLGQFEKALQYLKKFDAGGAFQIESRAYGMMGDASAELKKNGDALNYYKKAAGVNTGDDFTSSQFLLRAATFAFSTGNNGEAVKLFSELKQKYPLTEGAASADAYLARLGKFSD